jgi:hypothetical protein
VVFFHEKSKNRGVWERNKGKKKLNRHQTGHHHHTSAAQERRECQDASNDTARHFFLQSSTRVAPKNSVVTDVLTHVAHVFYVSNFISWSNNYF